MSNTIKKCKTCKNEMKRDGYSTCNSIKECLRDYSQWEPIENESIAGI